MCRANITHQLRHACCHLLGGIASIGTASANEWYVDMGLMNYIEQDRNTGIEYLLNAQRQLDNEDTLVLQAEFDVITGATPNGASASNVVQTFTMASGNGSYNVDANTLPADDTHMDTRIAFSLGYDDKASDTLQLNYSSHISMEFDYLSLGAGFSLIKDINQHNTQLLFSTDFEYNRVHPVGNVPTAFASMQPVGDFQPREEASVSRRQHGISLGLNQILSRHSLMQLKYAYAEASGYLTDPYKILSIVDDVSTTQPGATLDYVYEHRPRQRQIESIYTAYKTRFGQHTIDLAYRYYWDDWEIRSSTADLKIRYQLNSPSLFLQPHLRIYQQTSAEFYQHSLKSSEPLADYASADLRLAAFDAYTLGIRFGKLLANTMEHSIGVEYYTQRGDSHPQSAIGLQQQQDLFPDLHTLILTWNYAFYW